MRPSLVLFMITLAVVLGFSPESVWAQRGRGGGGGGGIRGGGGGGYSRPSAPSSMNRPGGGQSFSAPQMSNRTPSMSRTAPSPSASNLSQRPAAGQRPTAGTRPTTADRPTAQRPTANRPMSGSAAADRAGQPALNSNRSFEKPTSSQVNDFLKLPGSGQAAANKPTANRTLSQNTTSGDGSGGGTKSYTTDRGTTITVGGKAGSGTTEGGANVGGAVGGIKIETAGGDTIARGTGVAGASKGDSAAIAAGSRTGVKTAEGGQAVAGRGVRAATDGENSAIRGGGFAAGVDAEGNAAAVARGGYADSTGYRQGAAMSASRNADGYARVNVAAGYNNNGTGQIKTGTAIVGPNGNVVSAGRGAAFVNGQFVGGTAWTAVNGNYTHWGYFGPGYVSTYPNCWWPGKWAVATTAWSIAAYSVAAPYVGCDSSATYYDYGTNVTYEDGTVYYDEEPVATAEQYYEEAGQIADAGEQTENEEWLPLGVFAVIASADQTDSQQIVQLAVNKEGAIRGNFHNQETDEVTPVVGSVNKENQRVALKLKGNDQLLVETGLYNLTNDECPVLVHYGPEKQEQLTLIRLHQPGDETGAETGQATEASGDKE